VITRIRKILTAPYFEGEEEKTRAARLLNVILLTCMAISLAVGVVSTVLSPSPTFSLITIGLILLAQIGTLLVMRRGHVRFASGLLSTTLWVIVTLSAIFAGGVRSASYTIYTIIILIAGMLLGWRAGLVFLCLSVVTGLGMLYADVNGYLPPPLIMGTAVSTWVSQTAAFVATAALLFLSVRSVADALERAQHNEVELALAVAQLLREAAERWRIENTLRRQADELTALQETILDIVASTELDELLHTIVERAARLIDAEGGGLYLCEPENKVVRCVVSYSTPNDFRGTTLAYGEGASGMVAQTGEPLLIDDYRVWPNRAAIFEDEQPFTSVLAVPLLWKEQVTGVVNLLRYEENRGFTEEELELLTLFANYAAVATENARLYGAVQSHAVELAAALTHTQELDHLKNQFIQNVSHELRSPLALIQGYAELLTTGELGNLDSDQIEAAEVIARRTHLLTCLVEDITLILSAEARPLSLEPVALDELARAAVEDHRIVAQQEGLTLTAQIPSQVQPVAGEPIYVQRIIENLLGNAIKFTPSGGNITLSVQQEGDHVILEVADSGVGIPDDQQELIFGRFYQVDGSSRRQYRGVGLGLALVKEAAEALGGSVSVESQVGQGSTFTVRLPVVQV
jgi:signal transduction histidine kinase